MESTENEEYAVRLRDKSGARWKQALNVQAPYRWNLRRQHLGRTLDVGCGIGRNLATLAPGSVGVDHNKTSVAMARAAGFEAYTVDEWAERAPDLDHHFDGLLFAHVIEHLDEAGGEQLVRDYLPVVRPAGRIFFICPQERGYASDATHVRWTTGDDLVALAERVGLRPESWSSFPFPRAAGRAFTYNEFTLLAHKPA